MHLRELIEKLQIKGQENGSNFSKKEVEALYRGLIDLIKEEFNETTREVSLPLFGDIIKTSTVKKCINPKSVEFLDELKEVHRVTFKLNPALKKAIIEKCDGIETL